VSLTIVLAHSSGEWIASDRPVCALSEMATPRRMGAALTYARRYALFTLVGIAGEDDLDAPDLVGQPSKRFESAGNGLDAAKANGSSAGETYRSFSAKRKPWSPPKPALEPQKSAALRDQLVGELATIVSQEEATAWAQRVLGAKNTLITTDAGLVEAAFTAKLAGFGDGGLNEEPCPLLADSDGLLAALDLSAFAAGTALCRAPLISMHLLLHVLTGSWGIFAFCCLCHHALLWKLRLPAAADDRQDLAGDVAGARRCGHKDVGGCQLFGLRRALHL
jgi:ERF superfamily